MRRPQENPNERTRELELPHFNPEAAPERENPGRGTGREPERAPERPRRRSDWAEETPLDDLPTLADELLGPRDGDDGDDDAGRAPLLGVLSTEVGGPARGVRCQAGISPSSGRTALPGPGVAPSYVACSRPVGTDCQDARPHNGFRASDPAE